MRCFIAVDLPEHLKTALTNVQQEFEMKGISLVRPDALHVTLRFLGEITEDEVELAKRRLVSVKCERFDAMALGLGYFSPQRVSVIFAKIQDSSGFKTLHDNVNSALNDVINLDKEQDYVPHITIARVRHANINSIESRMKKAGDADFGVFNVDSFCLKLSRTTPDGHMYTTLKKFRLGS